MDKPRFMLVSLERLPEDVTQRYGLPEQSSEPHYKLDQDQCSDPQHEIRPDSGFESGIDKADFPTTHACSSDIHHEEQVPLKENIEICHEQVENSSSMEVEENNLQDSRMCELSAVDSGSDISVKEMTYSGQVENKVLPIESEENANVNDYDTFSDNKLSHISQNYINLDQVTSDKSAEIDPFDFDSAETDIPHDKSHTSSSYTFKNGHPLVSKKHHSSNNLSRRKNYAPKANKPIKIVSIKNTKGKGSELALESSVSCTADMSHVNLQENADIHSQKALSVDLNGRKLAEEKINVPKEQADVNGLTRVFTWEAEQPWQGQNNPSDCVGNESYNSTFVQDIGLNLTTPSRKVQLVDSIAQSKPGFSSDIQANGSCDNSSYNKYMNLGQSADDLLTVEGSPNSGRASPVVALPSESSCNERKSDSPLSTASTASLCIDYPLPEDDIDVIQTSSLDLSMTGCNKNGIVNTGTVPTIKMHEAEKIVRNIELSVDSNKVYKPATVRKQRKIQKKHTARKSHGRLGKEQYYVTFNPNTGNPVVTKRKSTDEGDDSSNPKNHKPMLEKSG